MKKIVIVLTAAVAFALPANASAAQLKGVVVGKEKASGVLVIAARNGTAWSVRTTSQARVGAVVTVSAKRLPNGTFAATSLRVSGRTSRARVRGVVIRSGAGSTFLSAGRSVLAVRSNARSLMSAASSEPTPGTVASVGVEIGPGGSLTSTSMTTMGHSGQIVIQATVAAIAPATATTPGSVTFTVHGQPLVIPLPAGTTLPQSFVVGSTVMLTIRFRASGPEGTNPHGDDTEDDDSDDAQDSDDTDDD